jgi:hypothetical protein
MSELKIVTPEECAISEDTKRELVDDINQTLLSGQRKYCTARAHVGFIRGLAEASGWSVSHLPDDRGNVIGLLFTTSDDRVEPACVATHASRVAWPNTLSVANPQWIGASPR